MATLRVRFEASGVEVACSPGETVFDIARRSGVAIPTSCVGRATCGLCRIRVVDGEDNLSPVNDSETNHLGNVYFITKVRLSCQTKVEGEGLVVVEVLPKKR